MNIIICDSNERQRELCRRMVAEIARKNNIPVDIMIMETTAELIFKMEDDFHSIDLIYLDVEMQKIDGLAAAGQLRTLGYQGDIIFYSSSRELGDVFGAFDVLALHYILKQEVSEGKFGEVFLKACGRARKRDREVILLTCAGETRCIPLEDIRYFEVNKRIVSVHYDQEVFEFYSSLSKIEEHLFGKGFLRIHQSILVAKKAIQKVAKKEVTLFDGTVLPIGRTYKVDYNNEGGTMVGSA